MVAHHRQTTISLTLPNFPEFFLINVKFPNFSSFAGELQCLYGNLQICTKLHAVQQTVRRTVIPRQLMMQHGRHVYNVVLPIMIQRAVIHDDDQLSSGFNAAT